jgi:hypothetical protein
LLTIYKHERNALEWGWNQSAKLPFDESLTIDIQSVTAESSSLAERVTGNDKITD